MDVGNASDASPVSPVSCEIMLEEALPGGVDRSLSAVGGASFCKDVREVSCDSVESDEQLFGHFRVGLARGHQAQDLHFPLAQPIGILRILGGDGPSLRLK